MKEKVDEGMRGKSQGAELFVDPYALYKKKKKNWESGFRWLKILGLTSGG